ncbi:sensor domain-containing protein [Noviherbaspirillum aridicola]|uniref:GGDEF domain-containing protein n=1 Tax=Noviherbaspirillum aridicola TaxID=2849687 RepID=A0ABQ4Q8C8_9BURK|nr:bifunctional diguanylate cyclase/phosphodiesterase [Noviherbaspirillum aridicola]GIZ53306.1 GGDEF domain-containing protein [Noviherbaspirillum aridicola]
MNLLESGDRLAALLNAMIMNAMDAFIVVGDDDLIHEWNPEAERIFGWSRQEAIGARLSEMILPPDARVAFARGLRVFRSTGFHRSLNRRLELSALNKDGKRLPIEVTITPVQMEDTLLFCASIRDNRERRTIDTQLRQHQAELRQALDRLRQSQAELEAALHVNRRLMEYSLDVIAAVDADNRFVQVSAASQRVWGYRPEELAGKSFLDLAHPDDRAMLADAALTARRDGADLALEARFLGRNGDIVNVSWTVNWSRADERFYCVARDITASKKAAYALAERDQRFHSLFEHHPDGVFAFDLNGRLTSANQAFCVLTGRSSEELTNCRWQALIDPDCMASVRERFEAAVRGTASNFETTALRKDSAPYDAHVTLVPIVVDGRIVGVHGIARDITHGKSYERRIEYLATYDALTGLPNRNLLDDRLRHALVQAERDGHRVAVLFLDLNRFKLVNDSLGHDMGDALLRIVADRLKSCVREADTVARLGGDEFVIVLENIATAQDVVIVARNVLAQIEKPVTLEGHEFVVSGSIGCSLYPKDGSSAGALLRAADLAMYEAKSAGGGAFRLYREDMNERVKARLLQEHQLRLALEKGELVVWYQPRVDIAKQRIVGAEALLRWQHPERGLVPPNEFIPLAEEIGLIEELGTWVLKTACRQNRLWQASGLPPLKVSVNISPHQLAPESSISQAVQDTLRETGLDPKWLELEITESSLMQNVESTLTKLVEIRDAGVSISIDDFGTGYSSLSYLRHLPVDALKIDQSFIRDISASRDNAAIVSATIALAHTMDLKVVAEGVTTEDQVRFLQSHECDEVQGYILSPAVPPDDLSRLLRQGKVLSRPGQVH